MTEAATTAWILTDGKIGDEIPCRGVAEAMGLGPECRTVRPRKAFAAMSPWGFADPCDARLLLREPFPDIAFAAGRRAVPYLRALKRMSPGTFTVFFGNPRTPWHGTDLVWAPAHDGLVGPHVFATDITPHVHSARALARARETPDPRVLAIPEPRATLLIGGPSRHHSFGLGDRAAVIRAAKTARAQGFGLLATGSRRTPALFVEELRTALSSDPGAFVWRGDGDNPYPSFLALADAIVVTADSINMISETLAVGVPVHILRLAGGHPRLNAFVDGLVRRKMALFWTGYLARGRKEPIDSTPTVAAAVTRRFAAFRHATGARLAGIATDG